MSYVSTHFFEDGWSLDACVGRALISGDFDRSEIVCVKTLYNYVDLGLIRRFIPKGMRIDQLSTQAIADVETWCNSLPRKLLNYRTPDEIFEEELDKIYQLDAA